MTHLVRRARSRVPVGVVGVVGVVGGVGALLVAILSTRRRTA
jgi:hypothetical protein